MASSLLGALLKNESGGRNIPNVHQGTSSGQAQGYFQITTGTWDEFGGRKFAPNPLQATYEQQAEIASKIPLKRWDPSTIRMMQATGKPINVNATLGENLAMHGESFAGGAADGGGATQASSSPYTIAGPEGKTAQTQGPIQIRHPPNPAAPTATGGLGGYGLPPQGDTAVASNPYDSPYSIDPKARRKEKGLEMMAGALSGIGGQGQNVMPSMTGPNPGAARVDQPNTPLIDPQQNQMQRQQLAAILARLNSGALV